MVMSMTNKLQPLDFMGLRIEPTLIHKDTDGSPLEPAILALKVDLLDANDEPVTLLLDEYQIDVLASYMDPRREI
jgi:hypothetical protein